MVERETTSSRQKLAALGQALGPLLALVIVTIGFGIADHFWGEGRFSTWRNLRVVLVQTSPVAVAALGMTLIIISGGIDLSSGTASLLCATVLAWALNHDYSVYIAILFALATGASCGLCNGMLIGFLRIPPFIVTLGTMTIFLGLGKRLAGESTIFVERSLIPEWLLNLSSTMGDDFSGWVPRVASGVWVALLIAIIVACILHFTVLGRHLIAVGSNEATARLCGVNVMRTKLIVYALGGILIAVAGIYAFSMVKLASPTEGVGRELRFIAAVVIGGGSLAGGRGSVIGTLAGAMIMEVIGSGCTQLGISNSTQDIMLGGIIIGAVTIDQYRIRKQQAG